MAKAKFKRKNLQRLKLNLATGEVTCFAPGETLPSEFIQHSIFIYSLLDLWETSILKPSDGFLVFGGLYDKVEHSFVSHMTKEKIKIAKTANTYAQVSLDEGKMVKRRVSSNIVHNKLTLALNTYGWIDSFNFLETCIQCFPKKTKYMAGTYLLSLLNNQ